MLTPRVGAAACVSRSPARFDDAECGYRTELEEPAWS